MLYFMPLKLIIMSLLVIPAGQANRNESEAVIRATLVEMAPDPGVNSGVIVVYRFARYQVDVVCKGRFSNSSEIVVGHIVPLEPRLPTQVGSVVLLSLQRQPKPIQMLNLFSSTLLSERRDVQTVARLANTDQAMACGVTR